MAYIGREPQIGNYQVCDALSVVNAQAAYTMQVSSVNVIPESVNHMIVSLNGVIQKPGSSYTISGATITFSRNLVTGETIDFIYLLGNVLDLGTPSDDTVTGAKIVDNAINSEHYTDASIDLAHLSADSVDGSKIADNAINSEHYTDGSIDNAHIADDQIDSEHYVDGSIDTAHIADVNVTQGKIADQAINEAKMQISNAPSNGYMLTAQSGNTGGLTWAEAGGGSWVKIKTQTITSATASMAFIDGTGDVVFDSTYRRYVLMFDDCRPSSDNALLKLEYYQGSAYLTSGYITSAAHIHGGTSGMYTGTAYAAALNSCGSAASESAYGETYFQSPSVSGTKPSSYSIWRSMFNADGESNTHLSSGGHNTAGAITGFRLIFSSGNIANLQATLYGITT